MGVSKYLRALPVFSTAMMLVFTFAISAPVMAIHKDGAPHGKPGGDDTQAQLDALQAQIDVICENYPGFCTPDFTKAVFLTSSTTDGAFGGVGFADDTCQALADTVGLSGTFNAWISDSVGSSPSTTFIQSLGPYVRPDGVTVADDYQQLISAFQGIKEHINVDESGNKLGGTLYVWTATDRNGIATGDSCNNWTSNLPEDNAQVGVTDRSLIGDWTFNTTHSCDNSHHFICFEQ